MQIKLISYSESKLVAMNAAHEMITDSIKSATGTHENFIYCATSQEMLMALKEGIEKADIILVAVDIAKFISTKAALFRALGFKCRLKPEIIDCINSDACIATLNEKQTKAHAAIPVGGEAFITVDGLFSGIGISEGNQKLILVPIDERRIVSIINNGMIPFLLKGSENLCFARQEEQIPAETKEETVYQEESSEVYTQETVVENTAEETVKEAEEEEIPEEVETNDVSEESVTASEEESTEQEEAEQEKTESDIPADMVGYVEHIDAQKYVMPEVKDEYEDVYSSTSVETAEEEKEEDYEAAQEAYFTPAESMPEENVNISEPATIGRLRDIASRGFKVSFTRQTENIIYTNFLKDVANVYGVDFIDFPIDKTLTEDTRRKEAIASDARRTLRQTNSVFAVSMSELYYAEDNTAYIFVTLADIQKSSVYKIFAADGETAEDLYRIGFESVLEKMEEMVKNSNLMPMQPADNSAPVKEKKKISSSTLIGIWVLVIIAVATLTALILDSTLPGDGSVISSAEAIIENTNNLLMR